MSVFNVESNVYAGWSGNAISALDGESGTMLANIAGRTLAASVGAKAMLKRHGTSADQVVSVNAGIQLSRIALNLRDCSNTTRKLLFSALTSDGSGIRTSGGSTTVGQFSPTIQLWAESISDANDLQLYAPALAIAPEQAGIVTTWAQDASLYDGQELILVATRTVTQTTPALMVASNSGLAGVYFA